MSRKPPKGAQRLGFANQPEANLPEFREEQMVLIRPNPKQPRTNLKDESSQVKIRSLADSIEAYGLQQPIILRRLPEAEGDVIFEIVAGERRYQAHKLLGREKIPSLVLPEDSEANPEILALVENLQRENLNAVDLANAILKLKAQDGFNFEKVGQIIGMSKGNVSRLIGVLKLDDVDKKFLDDYRVGSFEKEGEVCKVSDVVTGTALSEFSFVARNGKLTAAGIEGLWQRIRTGELPKGEIRVEAEAIQSAEPETDGEPTKTQEPKPQKDKPSVAERSLKGLTKAIEGLHTVPELSEAQKERLRGLKSEIDVLLSK